MSTAKIGFKGYDPSIQSYELTQIGPVQGDGNPGTANVVGVIPANADTFTFPAPTVAGDYLFSVQAYDANHLPIGGPQSMPVHLGAPAPGNDNIPASITVSI